MGIQKTTAVLTGLSDFHKLMLTVLKTSITKSKSQIITYRDYKNFEWKCVLAKERIAPCTKFDEMCFTKNDETFKKSNYKEVLPWKSIFKKKSAEHFLRNYKKQKKICSRLYKKEINISFVCDNKLFWKRQNLFCLIMEVIEVT